MQKKLPKKPLSFLSTVTEQLQSFPCNALLLCLRHVTVGTRRSEEYTDNDDDGSYCTVIFLTVFPTLSM